MSNQHKARSMSMSDEARDEPQINDKLSHEEFTLLAIKNLRTGDWKGIHTVLSGFNRAFKEYFDGADPVEATKKLVSEGKITMRPAKRGVLIFDPKEDPGVPSASETLKQILSGKAKDSKEKES